MMIKGACSKMSKPSTYQSIPLSLLQDELDCQTDVFICSASFETRCLSASLALNPKMVETVHVLRNEDVLGKGCKHASLIEEHFQGKASPVVISKTNPVLTADRIINALSDLKGASGKRVLVDITTFTHETLLILYKIISLAIPEQCDVRFVYTNAKYYFPGASEGQSWLSRGVSEVRSVLGYPGDMRPSRKSHLIVLVGYEDERAGKLIEMYEPSTLSLGVGGVEAVSEHLQSINQSYYRKLLELRSDAEKFNFSPTDAYAVRDVILEQAQKFSDHNVIVAPMNTKISTLGVALAAMENPNIQICYGRAAAYNVDNYSEPADDCRLFSLSQ